MGNDVGDESGFTLIELMVVIVIIGILVAIAIPLVRQNIKTAVKVTLVSDVREAAVQMEKDAIASSDGGYGSSLSSDYHHSENNNIILVDNAFSDSTGFCIIGKNDRYPDLYVYYSSDERIVNTTNVPTGDCGTGQSYPAGSSDGSKPTTEVSPGMPPPAPIGYDDSKRKKYTICHGSNALNLPLPAIINGHSGHPDDIIPPIPAYFPSGLNWTDAGSTIWYNNCNS